MAEIDTYIKSLGQNNTIPPRRTPFAAHGLTDSDFRMFILTMKLTTLSFIINLLLVIIGGLWCTIYQNCQVYLPRPVFNCLVELLQVLIPPFTLIGGLLF